MNLIERVIAQIIDRIHSIAVKKFLDFDNVRHSMRCISTVNGVNQARVEVKEDYVIFFASIIKM